MSTKRIAYIDALRGFTMILVVYQHISLFMGGVNGYGSIWSEALTSFRMPLFFFISGYIAYKVIDWTPQIYAKLLLKKAQIQLIPTFIFSIIYTTVFYSHTRIYAGEYWFTLVLFEFFVLFYTISLIAHRCDYLKLILLLLLACVGIVFFALHMGQDWSCYQQLCFVNVFQYFQFFVLGILSRRYEAIMKKILCNSIVNAIAVGIFVLSLILISSTEVLDIAILRGLIRSIILRYSGLFIVLSLFYRHQDFFAANGKISQAMQYIGRHTLDIYMLHYFFIDFGGTLAGKIHNLGYLPLEIFGIGILALMNIVLSLGLSQCIRNSKLLAKYLFGARTA